MTKARTLQGKAAELHVISRLLNAGMDCYQTIVDDKGIDAIIRIEHSSGARYFDVQIKSSQSWSNVRGSVSKLGKCDNAILLIFNSSTEELFWLDPQSISKRFPQNTVSNWGDIFLNKNTINSLIAEGRNDLAKLRDALNTGFTPTC